MPRIARRAAPTLVALAGALVAAAGCRGGSGGAGVPNPAFAAKVDGSASERATHLGRLDRAFTENGGSAQGDLDAVKETFVAYTGAVIETADAILVDPEAGPEDARKAAESKFSALERRAEFEPEARPAILAAAAAIDRGPHAKVLRGVTAFNRVRALCDDITPQALLELDPAGFDALADAAAKLGAVDPPHPRGPEVVFQVAQAADRRGLADRARDLFTLFAERFPADPAAPMAAGAARRFALVGKVLDGFAGPGVAPTGPPVRLEDLRGKVVLIDFWATWCGPCMAEIPAMKALRAELAPKGFEILGVNLDSEDARRKVGAFDFAQKAGWPQILAAVDQAGPFEASLGYRFGVSAIPLKMLVDRDGTLVACGLSLAEFRPRIEALLDPPAPTSPPAGDATPAP